MFYHPNDNKITVITKHLIFWVSMFVMCGLFLFSLNDDIKIPQEEVILEVDIHNKVNICTAEKDVFEKKFFFKF